LVSLIVTASTPGFRSSPTKGEKTMPGLVIIAIVGALIALSSFLSAIGIYTNAANAIHQIYAALGMMTAVLGLLILAVAAGAAVIQQEIRETHRGASAERRKLAEAMRLIAEHRRAG
jgi:hypothetical protein